MAARARVNPQTLQYYERRGLLPEPDRSSSGYRAYGPQAVRIVRFIKRAQQLGFALDDVESLLHLAEGGPDSCDAVRAMAVEMVHTEGCPHAADYLPRLRRLVADSGRTEPVRVRVVNDPDQARQERFLGSPTIRVDGRDVDPGADERRDSGLSCRLYAGPDGLRGTPPDEWVLSLLRPRRPPTADRRPPTADREEHPLPGRLFGGIDALRTIVINRGRHERGRLGALLRRIDHYLP
ncbi:hypothetical protein PA7_08380 [Pseudonocardia asaccharolytica DSM 44247 = NBRC 16224]|uniref:HTH merR-type domain-containing protein n=1 Tax=Pseudonocardia asaccharolytica DSM 44247 = NBRC 16224 TaxID=1123024 RepID=A0A511CWS0_9PSEU|nr:hypothetical protein PA7_08380 [Pseudonocardia asaccharolytica DSM 44247 = NBRC 16224]